jgi:hypothetical protein
LAVWTELNLGSTGLENMVMKILFQYKLGDTRILSTCVTFTFTLRFTLVTKIHNVSKKASHTIRDFHHEAFEHRLPPYFTENTHCLSIRRNNRLKLLGQ